MNLGAYGLRLDGIPHDPSLPVADPGWETWELVAARVTSGHSALDVRNISGLPGHHLAFDWDSRQVQLVSPVPLQPEALIHPWFTTISAVVAARRGRDTFHSGGVVVEGRVWALLGAKEAGKTSSCLALAHRGFASTGDDLVVVDGTHALTGSATFDLRETAAKHFGIGTLMELLPDRHRWRVALPAAPLPSYPLAGFIEPVWSDTAGVHRVPLLEGLSVLSQNMYVTTVEGRAQRMLDLATLPVLRWARPRSWPDLDASLDTLVSALTRQS